jgi:hypothetical protein
LLLQENRKLHEILKQFSNLDILLLDFLKYSNKVTHQTKKFTEHHAIENLFLNKTLLNKFMLSFVKLNV